MSTTWTTATTNPSVDAADSLLAVDVSTLLAVAQCRSMSGAAHLLKVRQSTVSRRVRDLEDRIGASVFERTPVGVRPTDAGRQLLARLSEVRNLLTGALEEVRDAGTARTGRLRLGFVGSFATAPAKNILSRFRLLHPGVNCQLAELGAAELIQRVTSHKLDCAWIAGWRSPHSALQFEPLWQESLCLAAPTADLDQETVRWSDLSGRVLLARPEAELDLLIPVIEKAGVRPPEVQFHDCSRESLISMVADGEGVAIMPESFARLGRPGVHFARIAEEGVEVAIAVVYRYDRDNPVLRRLLAVTRDWLRENRLRSMSPSGPA